MTRIREIRLAMGATLADIASRSGITPSYLQKLESGARRANLDVLHRIAKALGVTGPELVRPLDEPLEATTGRTRKEHKKPLYVMELPVSEHVIIGAPEAGDSAETFPVLPHMWSPGRYILRAFDDSMYPTIQAGDLVLVENRNSLAPQDVEGKVCIVVLKGEAYLKRVLVTRRGGDLKVSLKADNPLYPPIPLGNESDYSIQGICLEVVSRSLI